MPQDLNANPFNWQEWYAAHKLNRQQLASLLDLHIGSLERIERTGRIRVLHAWALEGISHKLSIVRAQAGEGPHA